METADAWRKLFETWPDDMERRGSVLSKKGESIGFDDFRVSNGILLLGRSAPDASGARRAFIGFEDIEIVKLPTLDELTKFHQMGFQQPSGKGARRTLSSSRTRPRVER